MSNNESILAPSLMARARAINAGVFDPERHNLWVPASFGFISISEWTIAVTQGLGYQDARLIMDDYEVIDTGMLADPYTELGEHVTKSYHWVLGLYEIVRTISQHAKVSSSPLHTFSSDIDSLKHTINLTCSPLINTPRC
jgi:hypothetical protein